MLRQSMLCQHSLPLLSALTFGAATGAAYAIPDQLSTVAERSGFQKTGRYAEVEQLCPAFAKAYPHSVRCVEFGRTPENRPMLALIATNTGVFDAAEARRRQLPVLLVQGGIHAGEIDGKDAGFLALRELLDGKAVPGALDKQVLLFVPVFNVDGHERYGRWNRPNQRGPEEMGWRTTAQNYNLNRDYVKADAPEMQAMLQLLNGWDPLAYIDLHVTDGAKFEHDVSIQIEPVHAGDADLQRAGRLFQKNVIADLQKQGSLPLPFYMSFNVDDDPMSGFTDKVPAPRFSTTYNMLRNRFGMLVEAHSWKDYATRVRLTHNAVISVVNQIAEHGDDWRKLAMQADARAEHLGGQDVPLTYEASDKTTDVAFRGYSYTRTMSEVSGALMTHYDESAPQIWHVKLRYDIQPKEVVAAPRGGYVIAPAFAPAVAEKLREHGLQFQRLSAPMAHVQVESFRATQAQFSKESDEGHQDVKVDGRWKADTRDIAAGSLFVPIAQPRARLVMALLEPQAPDSLASWGYFNNAFEKKEYMEAYVAEDVAREQLAADPALKQAFERKLATDAAFAENPEARLEFFARRHSSWDERYMLYPVLRTADVLR